MIEDRMGDLESSRKSLLRASDIVEELYTVSVSKEVATFLYNDSAQAYPGEDYEKVALHALLALSFLEDGDFAAARVEAKKINSMLAQINSRYDDNKNRYSEDAFARYLAGAIYESRGEIDSAIIDYTRALKLYESDYSKYFGARVPRQLVIALAKLLETRSRRSKLADLRKRYGKWVQTALKELKTDKRFGEVLVIHEIGTIQPKMAEEFFLPIAGQVMRFSFPTIRGVNYRSRDGDSMVASSGQKKTAELAQNMSMIAHQTLEDKRLRLMAKQDGRMLIKGVATQAVRDQFGELAGLAANALSAATETTDTRSWMLFPDAFYISRIRLKPGKHVLQVTTEGRTKEQPVTIKAGRLMILRDKIAQRSNN